MVALTMVASILTQPDSQNTETLKEAWESIHPQSCPFHYNFHLHTVYSDGQLTPERLIEQATAIGLKGMAITDHHSVGGYDAARQWLAETRQRAPQTRLPHLWTGIEVTSNFLGIEVHLLGYGFEPEHAALQPYLQGQSPKGDSALAETVIAAIQEAGGLAVLAHPARYQRPAAELIPAIAELGIDGVEAYYAYGNPKPWTPSRKETEQVKYFSEAYGLFVTCGTDTHGVNILQRL